MLKFYLIKTLVHRTDIYNICKVQVVDIFFKVCFFVPKGASVI